MLKLPLLLLSKDVQQGICLSLPVMFVFGPLKSGRDMASIDMLVTHWVSPYITYKWQTCLPGMRHPAALSCLRKVSMST